MFCPKCGTQIPENDHYCPTCGEPVLSKTNVPDESDHTAMFEEALESGLYFEMAKYANNSAARIVEAIRQSGFELYCPFQTNQIFVLVPAELGQELSDTYGCFIQARLPDGNWAVRIVTSCATTEDAIADLSEWFIKKACAGIVKNYINK